MKAILAKYAGFTVNNPFACPGCHSDLVSVSGEPTGVCPVCDTGKLKHRKLDLAKCPVCRTGQLDDTVLDEPYWFCPVCRGAPLAANDVNATASHLTCGGSATGATQSSTCRWVAR